MNISPRVTSGRFSSVTVAINNNYHNPTLFVFRSVLIEKTLAAETTYCAFKHKIAV